jgi:tetratricopeptide (TPR) repeat protein
VALVLIALALAGFVAHAQSLPQGSVLLRDAQTAFVERRFKEARDLAARVPDDDPAVASARYVQGYALYKLGQLERAAEALKRSQTLQPSAQTAFLSAIVAVELKRWGIAEQVLAPLVASRQPPWAAPAAELQQRVRRQITEQRQAEAQARHNRAIERAEAHLKAKRYTAARQALDEAEQALGRQLLTSYYRGYLAYETGDLAAARGHIQAALRIAPQDAWSSYLLALTLDNTPQRTALLGRLATAGPDAAVRRAAQQALITHRPPTRNRWMVQLELGLGLDTNPAHVAAGAPASDMPPPPGEGSATPVTTSTSTEAMALRGRIHLGYQRQLTAGHQGSVGVRFFEQDYVVNGSNAAKTEISGSLEYTYDHRGRFDLSVGYDYTLHLFHYDPLMSVHEVTVTPRLLLRPWLLALSSATFRWRDVHNDAYPYLEALELSGSVGLGARWKIVTVQGGYHLLHGWANPTTQITHVTITGHDMVGDYRADFSALAHGPQLELELRLPWRLTLSASFWALWYRFDHPDQFSAPPTNAVAWQQQRRDLLLYATAELKRPLDYGLEVAALFSSLDNFSSAGISAPINMCYARRTVIGVVRWYWPIR